MALHPSKASALEGHNRRVRNETCDVHNHVTMKVMVSPEMETHPPPEISEWDLRKRYVSLLSLEICNIYRDAWLQMCTAKSKTVHKTIQYGIYEVGINLKAFLRYGPPRVASHHLNVKSVG